MSYKFGAFPPPANMWQLGKTAATIALVKELEAVEQTPVILTIIQALKDGKLTATDYIDLPKG